ncbi:hypothetical protein [Abyssogena phaseoliformis symbiont]|uniref:hypothetical protein n=1 Tax=Abyssogena phaseoliformis symbiont TaxID=596095 RepID=UPI0019155A2C|nr:hypothetical protein [Abyssogena phaseoliformis symbiont]
MLSHLYFYHVLIPSVFLSRSNYNDIGDSFTQTFVKVANQYFGIDNNDILGRGVQKLKEKSLEIDVVSIQNHLIINANIRVYYDFINQLKNTDVLNHKSSYNDIKKFYDLLLYREIVNQEEQSKFGNVARSYGKLKSSMNVWLKQFIKENSPLYAIVCNDLSKDTDSVLKIVIEEALKEYKPIPNDEVLKKVKKYRTDLVFSILPEHAYSDNYELNMGIQKYALDKCYLNYTPDIEKTFIHYLESQESVDWWYKNADSGRRGIGNSI